MTVTSYVTSQISGSCAEVTVSSALVTCRVRFVIDHTVCRSIGVYDPTPVCLSVCLSPNLCEVVACSVCQ